MFAAVEGHGQGLFTDIANQQGVVDDKGMHEIRSDRPLLVTSRTFNQSTRGTYGQFLAGMTANEGLRSGESATLPQLVQNLTHTTPNFRGRNTSWSGQIPSCRVSGFEAIDEDQLQIDGCSCLIRVVRSVRVGFGRRDR